VACNLLDASVATPARVLERVTESLPLGVSVEAHYVVGLTVEEIREKLRVAMRGSAAQGGQEPDSNGPGGEAPSEAVIERAGGLPKS